MRKIRDILRLKAGGLSKRRIAASLGLSATAAGDCIRRARVAGIGWPVADDMTDEALERRLYPPPAATGKDRRSQPDTSEEALKAELYQQIGQLQVELDWLKKKSGLSR